MEMGLAQGDGEEVITSALSCGQASVHSPSPSRSGCFHRIAWGRSGGVL